MKPDTRYQIRQKPKPIAIELSASFIIIYNNYLIMIALNLCVPTVRAQYILKQSFDCYNYRFCWGHRKKARYKLFKVYCSFVERINTQSCYQLLIYTTDVS